jgi:hypothetical protein
MTLGPKEYRIGSCGAALLLDFRLRGISFQNWRLVFACWAECQASNSLSYRQRGFNHRARCRAIRELSIFAQPKEIRAVNKAWSFFLSRQVFPALRVIRRLGHSTTPSGDVPKHPTEYYLVTNVTKSKDRSRKFVYPGPTKCHTTPQERDYEQWHCQS